MALKAGDPWFGYAPATIRAHKYAVRYHRKVGRRVACTVVDRDTAHTLTLFSPDPYPDIEQAIPDGGPFFVNEWKQVLKPASGEEEVREVRFLGEFPDLHFRFRFRDRVFDNADTEGLRPGDRWPHQETGMEYQYDLANGLVSRDIRQWEEFAIVETTEELRDPPAQLMEGFAKARPGRRAGRFYLNEHGVAILPSADEQDYPVFVGRVRIGTDPWFDKHEGDAP